MFAKKSISRIFSVLFVIVFILAVMPLQAAHAAVVRYAKPAATGTNDCLSWANACTLQTALTGAVSGDEIWAAAGTYKPTTGSDRSATFQLINGVAVYGGFAGTETTRSQRNPAVNVTILSGDLNGNDNTNVKYDEPTRADNSYHVVTGVDGATMDGFTITAGNANIDVPYDPNSHGGGMSNNTSSPTLTNVTFSGNSAIRGGGLYNDNSSPTLTNITFSGNSTNMTGGGGGGMYNHNNSSPILSNVTFRDNSGNRGGGISNFNSSNPTLTNVTFSGNSAIGGGGMLNNAFSSPTLTNVTFSGNSAVNEGGGILNDHSSPTLTNVTFSGNSADYGGGISNYLALNPTIRNTIFWGNTATSDGAQIYNDSSTPIVSDSVVQNGCPVGSTCTNIITADPLLGSLGNYGGFTQTIPLLLLGSSAINATSSNCPDTDQRGVPRSNPTCDIGAFEGVDTPPIITSNGGGATASVSVAERTTAVTTVTATDADASATQTYSISGGIDASKFMIDATSGALAFARPPDFESPTDTDGNNVYNVTVQVSDGSLTDSQAIAVTVTDINEPTVSTTIGEPGGNLTNGNGDVSLHIPPGAVSEDLLFSIIDQGGEYVIAYNDTTLNIVSSYTINPHGMVFEQPVSVTFHWPDVDNDGIVDGTTLQELNILLIKDGLIYTPACAVNPACDMVANTLVVTLTSLSLFELAGNAINNPPIITEGTSTDVTMSEDSSPTPFSLTLHATDVDSGDTITWSISTPASHGNASASGTGTSKSIGYSPALNYHGSDSFVVQVSDGFGGTDTITVNVTITAVGPDSFTIFLPLILH